MPYIQAISKIDFPFAIKQQEVKRQAHERFSKEYPQVERLIQAFDNTGISSRNFCQPIDFYLTPKSFEANNREYIDCALEYSIKAIEDCIAKSEIAKEDITDILFVSTTGLATPSLDAMIINRMRLNPHINRLPIWGLGCAGGVSGLARACTLASANPKATVLLVAVELCSLTFLREDFSKSNFIASSLFSDGVVATIVKGDQVSSKRQIQYIASRSKLHYNTHDVMGWDFRNTGFKVIFSRNIPSFIRQNIQSDILTFLEQHKLGLSDVNNFIFHPGGTKVIEAYEQALNLNGTHLRNTREVMKNYGNMSSATVLYVLEQFLREGYKDGFGLMLAMGPGFSTEMILLSFNGQ